MATIQEQIAAYEREAAGYRRYGPADRLAQVEAQLDALRPKRTAPTEKAVSKRAAAAEKAVTR
ncbi:MAG: hypothetical protein KA755_09050 [Candidatus Microthrix sp.]|nr:hypothetical protein [Candidatus Microthrix sp.]